MGNASYDQEIFCYNKNIHDGYFYKILSYTFLMIIICIPADGLATTLHGSTFHIKSPVEQPTANSLAKYGRHCMQDTPRCCLNFKTGDIPSPEIPFPEGT